MIDDSSRRGKSWWRLIVLAGALLGALGAATVIPVTPAELAGARPAAGPRIDIRRHQYSPTTLIVPAGTAVTWINRDDDVHTVTSSAQAFTSRGIDTDETFTYTFTTPGTYVYFCTLHPLMTAKIIVK